MKFSFGFFAQSEKKKTEFNAALTRLESRIKAGDLSRKLKFSGYWWKRADDFTFVDISSEVAKMLFGVNSDVCIGKSDETLVRAAGFTGSDKQLWEICRGSDVYLQDEKPITFIEFISDVRGEKHIWRTLKAKVRGEDGKFYLYGSAEFLDVVHGYEKALKIVEQATHCQRIKELSNGLYVYESGTHECPNGML